jgi:hypothetical protein
VCTFLLRWCRFMFSTLSLTVRVALSSILVASWAAPLLQTSASSAAGKSTPPAPISVHSIVAARIQPVYVCSLCPSSLLYPVLFLPWYEWGSHASQLCIFSSKGLALAKALNTSIAVFVKNLVALVDKRCCCMWLKIYLL